MAGLLFLTGLLTDLLWVAAVRASAQGQATLAAVTSFALAVINLSLVVAIFESNTARSCLGVLAFSAGSALGSWWLVRRQHALQKSGAARVDAHSSSRDGEGVGGPHAEGQETAEARQA